MVHFVINLSKITSSSKILSGDFNADLAGSAMESQLDGTNSPSSSESELTSLVALFSSSSVKENNHEFY